MNEKMRVLLIEDSLGDTRLISDMIESSGNGKFNFNNNVKLSSAIERLNKNNYDVILLDLNLPDSSGIETLITLKNKFKHIPIIVITDSVNPSLELAAVKEGAQDFLIKGHFDDRLLLKTLIYAVQRQKYEMEIIESENRFKIMADIAPVLIWMSGTDKLCNFFNKSWLEFRGRTFEEECGNGWMQGVHPDDYDYCLNTYTKACDARKNINMEYRMKRFDGEYRWMIYSGAPRFTANGTFNGYIGSCIDITERKKTEEALAASNARFEALIKSAMDAIISIDANQKIILFNQAAENIFKIPASEAMGKNINDFVPLKLREKHKNHIKNFSETNVSTRSMGKLGTLTGLRTDGIEFLIEASISQVEVSGEKIYTVIIRDISNRLKHETTELPYRAI